MRAWIRAQRSRRVVEYMPPYAPDLNPVETLWTNLKRQEPANLATDSLGEVMAVAWQGIERVRGTHHLPYAFARPVGSGCGEPQAGPPFYRAANPPEAPPRRPSIIAPATIAPATGR